MLKLCTKWHSLLYIPEPLDPLLILNAQLRHDLTATKALDRYDGRWRDQGSQCVQIKYSR